MFSLIITIISIALVAVLALATLYYGGDAFNKGTGDAQAAKIVNQGQQLLAAAELFQADAANAGVEMTMTELVARGYLKSVPVAYQGNGSVAEAWAASEWAMPVAGQPVFVADVEATGACKAVNKRTIGMDGILAKVHDSVITQCYGTSATDLKAVVGKNRAAYAAVDTANTTELPAADIVSDPVPVDATTGWLSGYTPTVTSASSGGGTTPPPAGSVSYTISVAVDGGVVRASGLPSTVDVTFNLLNHSWGSSTQWGAAGAPYNPSGIQPVPDLLLDLQTAIDTNQPMYFSVGGGQAYESTEMYYVSFDGPALALPFQLCATFSEALASRDVGNPLNQPTSVTQGACPVVLPTE